MEVRFQSYATRINNESTKEKLDRFLRRGLGSYKKNKLYLHYFIEDFVNISDCTNNEEGDTLVINSYFSDGNSDLSKDDKKSIFIDGREYTIDGLYPRYEIEETAFDATIFDDKGTPIAQHIDEKGITVILFDAIKNKDVDINSIIEKIDENVYKKKRYKNSWFFIENKDMFIKNISNIMLEQKETQLNQEKQKLNETRLDLHQIRERIIRLFGQESLHINKIEAIENKYKNIEENIDKEVRLIIKNPKVNNMFYEEGKIIISTKPLFITSDRGYTYYGGAFEIKINLNNADVRFISTSPEVKHHAYWTERDAHPHVNGETGEACLGNIGPTVIELCAQLALFPLVNILIDFLESANTSDAAGKHIYKWQRVEVYDNGTYKELSYDDLDEKEKDYIRNYDDDDDEDYDDEYDHWCEHCEQGFNGTYYSAYYELDTSGEFDNLMIICENCRDNHYDYAEDPDGVEELVYVDNYN